MHPRIEFGATNNFWEKASLQIPNLLIMRTDYTIHYRLLLHMHPCFAVPGHLLLDNLGPIIGPSHTGKGQHTHHHIGKPETNF